MSNLTNESEKWGCILNPQHFLIKPAASKSLTAGQLDGPKDCAQIYIYCTQDIMGHAGYNVAGGAGPRL